MTGRFLAFPIEVAAQVRASDAPIAVTGGSGWLGRTALEMLDSALGDEISSRVKVFGSTSRSLVLRSGRTLQCRPLSQIERLSPGPWLFLHFAFVTRDKVSQQTITDYIRCNEAISNHVLGAIQSAGASGVLMPSSGAVYRADRSLDMDMENNPYGALKVRDENTFFALARDLGFKIVIPRIFNLSGPFINKVEHYALSSFIMSARRENIIKIRAATLVVRSYVYAADLISLCFSLLLTKANAPHAPFDTAGELEIELSQLAQAVALVLGLRDLKIERPPIDQTRVDIYAGDATTYRDLAALHNIKLTSLAQQIQQTSDYLESFL